LVERQAGQVSLDADGAEFDIGSRNTVC